MSQVDFSSNPNQRTPCVLVLDASASMGEKSSTGYSKMDELNAGIASLEHSLRKDDTALVRVQLAIVSVGGPSDDAEVMMEWTDASNFSSFSINCGGYTPLGKGLQLALDLVDEGKVNLKAAGISYTRPWILVISDGEPTDSDNDWERAVAASIEAQRSNKVEVFSIGVEGANMKKMAEISTKPPLMLSGMKFEELFIWLSSSLSAASRSRPGENIQLPSTDPWRNVGI